ncbi:LuxR C-terminal-related transcriptional regulator [Microbacterium testaceum]|uniref:LuxR C-terminal-related transcriptional regulator n=1 Tax=Microbacterium testaceum TaxID=2033 RepID=UPI002AC6B167|nr:LuxR C-terminal-related transcriptional regulator [Microbacterium testaceum]MDZ5146138.1 LuxR C-terminal-related transcriptional regulator [Microbacterium testaceum]
MLIDSDTQLGAPRTSRRLSRFWAPRTTAVAQLRDALANDIVLLRGPAGVGKSSLLQQFALTLRDDLTVGVQLIDGAATGPQSLASIVDGFRTGPSQHVLIVDNHRDDGRGVESEALLDLLRNDDALHIVVATRHATGLESPLIPLEFDSYVLPASSLLMGHDDISAVLRLHGVPYSDEAVELLRELTFGWPALVQLAGAHLRLEELSMQTPVEVSAIAEYALGAFTASMEERLQGWSIDDVKLLSIPPYITSELARALGVEDPSGGLSGLMHELREAGFVWPSTTRLTLAAPIRERWLREIVARRPGEVERARNALLSHLVSAGEPLLAARLAAEAYNWSELSRIIASAGPQIWLRDATGFDDLVEILRAEGGTDPQTVEVLLTCDAYTAESLDAPTMAVAALAKLPDAKASAATDLPALTSRVHLLRASGRFVLASEAATLLTDVLRRKADVDPHFLAEAWYQIAMTHLAMGKLRDAGVAMGLSQRSGDSTQRVRARGAQAVLALIEGDVVGAEKLLSSPETEQWAHSPWGEPIQLARAWLSLEQGDARASHLLNTVTAVGAARELWVFAASAQSSALLAAGCASDALGALRSWSRRARCVPPSHFHTTHVLVARAKVMIALRQAKKAVALFEGPFAISPITAPTIALSLLYAGRTHDAYVASIKWGMHGDTTPRAALECLVVSVIADLRLNGPASNRPNNRRAEAISARHALWSPWNAVSPEERTAVFGMLSPTARHELEKRPSAFESSVSVPRLTKREMTVLSHLTPSSTIATIAEELVVSPNTVKSQMQSLYRKLDVSDRSSAIRAAHAWGLIDSEKSS